MAKTLDSLLHPLFRDPIAVGRCGAIFHQAIDQSQRLMPDFSMIPIGRMKADARQRRSRQAARQQTVPREAGFSPPATADTVDERSSRITFAAPQILNVG